MTDQTNAKHPAAPWRNFYGRRHGKRLRPGLARHLETTLDRLALPGVDWDDNPTRMPLTLPGETWLEIGFGSGEHLLHQAEANPEVHLIGCEPFTNGMATLLARIEDRGIPNIRVHPGDARDLLDVLPPASITRAFLLYPDPWPKKRHHRRRFVNAEAMEPLATALAPGAELRIATDIPDYVRHTLAYMATTPAFAWTAERPADWRTPWPDWHRTRYEAKALREGRTPHYLTFRRTGPMDAAPPAP